MHSNKQLTENSHNNKYSIHHKLTVLSGPVAKNFVKDAKTYEEFFL